MSPKDNADFFLTLISWFCSYYNLVIVILLSTPCVVVLRSFHFAKKDKGIAPTVKNYSASELGSTHINRSLISRIVVTAREAGIQLAGRSDGFHVPKQWSLWGPPKPVIMSHLLLREEKHNEGWEGGETSITIGLTPLAYLENLIGISGYIWENCFRKEEKKKRNWDGSMKSKLRCS